MNNDLNNDDLDDDLMLDAYVDQFEDDEDNEYFKYTEVEVPEDEKVYGDCVIKAISLATKQSYDTVKRDLLKIAKTKKSSFKLEKVYGTYLKRKGWKISDILLKPYKNDNGQFELYTVGEFCERIQHPECFLPEFLEGIPTQCDELIVDCFEEADENGHVVPGTPGHLTFIKNGIVHDNRDCFDYLMFCYWYKK